MNSRERLIAAINHEQPDRCPIDLGGCTQTGINASTLWKLKQALGMSDEAIRIVELSQMLGEVTEDVRQWSQTDVVGLFNRNAAYGFKYENWKPWTMDDGTPVLVPGGFEYDVDDKGNTRVYPQSDRSAPYTAIMPAGGSFFDSVDHSEGFDLDLDEEDLTPIEDFQGDFRVMDDGDMAYYAQESKRLYEETEYGIIGVLGGGGIGDVSGIPGPSRRHPKGIRRIEDWLVAHELFPDYIRQVFRLQTDVMLQNLERYWQAVGDRIQVVWVSGTDLGTQHSTFLRKETFQELYVPFYREMNDWVHQHTNWKTFYHSCGAIYPLLDDIADMGVDIINPVQCSATGMEPERLKEQFGDRLVFWGGGIDTQNVLPFGTPEEIEAQVRDRLRIFSAGGGYVFSTIHNIVANVPVENLIRMYETVIKVR